MCCCKQPSIQIPEFNQITHKGIALLFRDLEIMKTLIRVCPSLVDLNISECIKEHKASRPTYVAYGKEDKFLNLLTEIEKSTSNQKTFEISQNFNRSIYKS